MECEPLLRGELEAVADARDSTVAGPLPHCLLVVYRCTRTHSLHPPDTHVGGGGGVSEHLSPGYPPRVSTSSTACVDIVHRFYKPKLRWLS